jgi:hypothetical protein
VQLLCCSLYTSFILDVIFHHTHTPVITIYLLLLAPSVELKLSILEEGANSVEFSQSQTCWSGKRETTGKGPN